MAWDSKPFKRVQKPWGLEIWLELNSRYCYKRIYIRAGTRSSLQFHEHKLETNFIISGEATVLLENDEGLMEEHHMKAGGTAGARANTGGKGAGSIALAMLPASCLIVSRFVQGGNMGTTLDLVRLYRREQVMVLEHFPVAEEAKFFDPVSKG